LFTGFGGSTDARSPLIALWAGALLTFGGSAKEKNVVVLQSWVSDVPFVRV
jgi:hypothetical protein